MTTRIPRPTVDPNSTPYAAPFRPPDEAVHPDDRLYERAIRNADPDTDDGYDAKRDR